MGKPFYSPCENCGRVCPSGSTCAFQAGMVSEKLAGTLRGDQRRKRRMSISFEELPERYQKQVTAKTGAPERASKYGAKKTLCRGILFDSKKEARRFEELSFRLKGGEISDLKLQVNFTLLEGYRTTRGVRVRPIRYVADFVYFENGQMVVEDVKSSATKTREYLLKKKLLREKFGLEIKEV